MLGYSYAIGDRVKATLVGREWGEGTIMGFSNYSHGGSYLYPVFLLRKDGVVDPPQFGDEIWLPAISLEKI